MKSNAWWALVAVLMVVACRTHSDGSLGQGGAQSALFSKPIADFEFPATAFTLQAGEEKRLELPSGTVLRVPADAFQYADGTAATGEVNLSYRELRSEADVILSGITMVYRKDGKEHQFQTDGMFELGAAGANGSLQLRPGKTIGVDMGARQDGEYNMYRLDTETGQGWVEIPRQETRQEPNAERAKIEARIAELGLQEEPLKYNPSTDHLVDATFDYQQVAGLRNVKDVLWRFESRPSPEELSKLSATKWTKKTLDPVRKGKSYALLLEEGEQKLSLRVQPVLLKKNYEQAKNAYDAYLQELKALQARLEIESKMLRSYEVREMGWHNWDILASSQNLVFVDASFAVPSGQKVNNDLTTVYVISDQGSIVRQYKGTTLRQLAFDPSKPTKVVAFLENGDVATVPTEKLQNLGFAPGQVSKPHTFVLDGPATKMKELKSTGAFQQFLASL